MDKTVSITVDVEEWFHTNWFDVEKIIQKYYDGKYPETDVIQSVKKLLDLFKKHDVEATFFILGKTAEKYPGLISLIEKEGHEIACHGYYHNKNYNDLESFKKDIKKFKKDIYPDAIGFRFPNFDTSDKLLKIIIEEEFRYDSSMVPSRRIPGWYGNPDLQIKPYIHNLNGECIKEFPIAVSPLLRLPGGGGWYLRNLGYFWTKRIVKSLLKKVGHATIYIHPWEVSENNPDIKEISFHVFRNTGLKTLKRLENFIQNFNNVNFCCIKELLKQYEMRGNGFYRDINKRISCT